MLAAPEFAPVKDTATTSRIYWQVWGAGGSFLLIVTVALTLVSGAGYLWKNRALIEQQ